MTAPSVAGTRRGARGPHVVRRPGHSRAHIARVPRSSRERWTRHSREQGSRAVRAQPRQPDSPASAPERSPASSTTARTPIQPMARRQRRRSCFTWPMDDRLDVCAVTGADWAKPNRRRRTEDGQASLRSGSSREHGTDGTHHSPGGLMGTLRLTIAFWDYDRVRPLIDGTIRAGRHRAHAGHLQAQRDVLQDASPPGVRGLGVVVLQLHDAPVQGDDSFIAIPVFPSRLFRHSCIYVNRNAGINEPGDLIGTRIGVPEYSMTAAVFARGLLRHEYGVEPETIEWFSGHAGRLAAPIPNRLRSPRRQAHAHAAGAGHGPDARDRRNRRHHLANAPRALAWPDSPVRRLFADYRRAEQDYFAKTGIFPIMHTIVCARTSTRNTRGRPRASRRVREGKEWRTRSSSRPTPSS